MEPKDFHAALQALFTASGFRWVGGQNTKPGDGWYRLQRQGRRISVATRRDGRRLLLAAQQGPVVPHPGTQGVGWAITRAPDIAQTALNGLATLLAK